MPAKIQIDDYLLWRITPIKSSLSRSNVGVAQTSNTSQTAA